MSYRSEDDLKPLGELIRKEIGSLRVGTLRENQAKCPHYWPKESLFNPVCRHWQPAKPHYPGYCRHPDPETVKLKCSGIPRSGPGYEGRGDHD